MTRIAVRCAFLSIGVLFQGCRLIPESRASTRPADLVVYGRVWTGDSTKPWAGAVAIASDTIAAVGDSGEIARLAGKSTQVISNGKAMVVPGFMDGHTHFIYGGFQLTSVDLRDADTPEEFVRRIKAFAAKALPASGSPAATGITSAGPTPRCRTGAGSIR